MAFGFSSLASAFPKVAVNIYSIKCTADHATPCLRCSLCWYRLFFNHLQCNRNRKITHWSCWQHLALSSFFGPSLPKVAIAVFTLGRTVEKIVDPLCLVISSQFGLPKNGEITRQQWCQYQVIGSASATVLGLLVTCNSSTPTIS